MNFFGHAAVASWRSSDPTFVLGSMVPDFAGMLGERPPASASGSLGEGLSFHHATDRAFHASSGFVALQREAYRMLNGLGVGRGAALAVAHVGVELLIDAELARCESHRDAYLSALASATHRRSDVRLGARYRYLCRFLRLRGVSERPPSARDVATRLDRALAARPRLRLARGDDDRVARWVEAQRPDVARAVPSLIEELEAALGVRLR